MTSVLEIAQGRVESCVVVGAGHVQAWLRELHGDSVWLVIQDVGTTARGLLTVAQRLHSGSVGCFPRTEGFPRTPDVQC